MTCLCCGKPLKSNSNPDELQNRWHNACIKRFFGTNRLPDLNLSAEDIESIAKESIKSGFTVPGVQKKMSLHLSSEKNERARLTLVGYPAGYILKPQTEDYPALPEAEYLVMQMAKATGIKTVPFALIRLPGSNGYAYITKRIDRTPDGGKIAMEDFCQLDLRSAADKYKGSYERCGRILTKYSVNAGLDMTELFLRIVFSFAVGNSDMHLKNFSLVETGAESSLYRLSEAYDMLPVNVILPEDKDQMALTLNGKNRNLHRSDFLSLADSFGLNRRSAEKMINGIVSKKPVYLELCRTSLLPDGYREFLSRLIEERTAALMPGTSR